MPYQHHDTTSEETKQALSSQDEWTQQVLARLPSQMQEQANKLKAFERSRKISTAGDLLRGLLAYVYTAHSFQHVGLWSVLIGMADVPATDWRKRLRQASAWLDWLLQELLASAAGASRPWLRAGVRRILLIDGTHWKCLGPKGMVWRVHTAFDLVAGRLSPVKVTDAHEAEHLELFELQKGDVVVTDRANGLRSRVVFVLSQMADIIVRISPSRFPMHDEHGVAIGVWEWLRGLPASAGQICSRAVWISCAGQHIQLRLLALRLSQEQQDKAQRRLKRKASKQQHQLRASTLYYAQWVLVVTTLPQEHWSDEQVMQLYRARWHIELLFKRIKQLLRRQSLRSQTAATAKATITVLLVGWALLEEESAAVRQLMREAMAYTEQVQTAMSPQGDPPLGWPAQQGAPLSEWMLAEASLDLLCQQIRGSYSRERFRACGPRLQRFICASHRQRPHLYTQVCRWLAIPAPVPLAGQRPMIV
jgi:DDE family transposase